MNIKTLLLAMAFVALVQPASAFGNTVSSVAGQWEQRLQARIGVAVLDTGTDTFWGHRADERFPMASTSKTFLCAALLNAGPSMMKRSVTIKPDDILSYAPVTKDLVDQPVTAAELCRITLRTSDNTAANKVLDVLGSPKAVTRFLRSIGDQTTRLDRFEPDLNDGTPGDPRDTTTPKAAVETLDALLLGQALNGASRAKLKAWLVANQVGGPLLRSTLPKGWGIADRTGAGGFGTRGVLAVVWPPRHAPVVMAVYVTGTTADMNDRNRAIADIGRAVFDAIAHGRELK